MFCWKVAVFVLVKGFIYHHQCWKWKCCCIIAKKFDYIKWKVLLPCMPPQFPNCPVEIRGPDEARRGMWQFHGCYGHCAIRAVWPHVGKLNEQHVCLLHQSAPKLLYSRDERKLQQGSRKWNEEHLSHGFWVPYPLAFNSQEFNSLRCLFKSCQQARERLTHPNGYADKNRTRVAAHSPDLLLERKPRALWL